VTSIVSSEPPRPLQVATLGAAFSANKGAASMVQAVVDVLPAELGPCRIDVLTTYPDEDRQEVPDRTVRLVPLRPRELVFPVLPIALLVWIVRVLGGRGRLVARLHPATRSLVDADVVLDLAGISFAEGRGLPILVYNVLMTGVPLLLGRPVVKCSQAVGPFTGVLNRGAGRFVLPRVEAVLTRGETTHEHARSLGLTNARRADDLAFLLQVPSSASCTVDELLEAAAAREPFVAVAPSAVVRQYCAKQGLDYIDMLARFVRHVRAHHDLDIVIVPHSVRPGHPESRMNDLPACVDLHAAIGNDARVHLVARNLSPAELRALIGRSEVLVTSRFHAMISALATTTPPLVVGWSHKYEEVLAEFALTEYALPYSEFTPTRLTERFEALWVARAAARGRIARHLPEARDRAMVNVDAVRRVLDPASSSREAHR
jgi:colanic acid/amylovoran biosynthesis protein